MAYGGFKITKWTPPRNSGGTPYVSTRFSLRIETSRLTRDGTAEPVSRDQFLRRERGHGNINFPCSADHEQDWQPYPVDPYPYYMCDHTYMHALKCGDDERVTITTNVKLDYSSTTVLVTVSNCLCLCLCALPKDVSDDCLGHRAISCQLQYTFNMPTSYQ